MFNYGNNDVKLLDIANLAEEKLGKIIENIGKSGGNRRIKGLIVSHHAGYDIHINFRGGKPSLAIMKSKEVEISGRECLEKIFEIKDKVKGVIEIYEVSEKELLVDEENYPNAIIRSDEIKGVKTNKNIDGYSLKIFSIPLIRNLILKGKGQLRDEEKALEDMDDIGKVVRKVIADSKGRISYILVNFLGADNWKSFEIILRDGEVISSIITGNSRALTGENALNKIMELGKAEGKYIVSLYKLNEEDIELLNKSEIELKKIENEISLPKVTPKVEEVREKPKKIVMREQVKIDLEKVKDRASEYFKSTLNNFGYSMNDLSVNLIDGTIVFQVKISKRGFSFKRVKTPEIEDKLIDDAQWVMRSIGYNVPVKINVS